jgi:SAM-dependent methyltransferase
MDTGFAEYLHAKYPLDERSLNPRVRALLVEGLRGRKELSCLDLGTGTGAMLRRLVEWFPVEKLMLIGVDSEPSLLDQVRESFETLESSQVVELNLQCATLADFRGEPEGYDLVTAQTFMDLVPLQETLRRVWGWLKPGGLFYATLNYDGGTHLLPPYGDEAFEARLLDTYDRSMELRRVDGRPTGGARSGTRLLAALVKGGFEILAYGSSDWNMTPEHGEYRNQDEICLRAILDWIRKEGAAAGTLDRPQLGRWFLDRLEHIRFGQLGLIVHQLDILAGRG